MVYIEDENFAQATLWGWIYIAVIRIPIVYTISYMIFKVYFKKESVDKKLLPFIKYSYVLMYIGFLLMEQDTSSFLSPRLLDATYCPLAIAITYYMATYKNSTSIRHILSLFLFYNLYIYLYSLYIAY
jgi:hypothetical protein